MNINILIHLLKFNLKNDEEKLSMPANKQLVGKIEKEHSLFYK